MYLKLDKERHTTYWTYDEHSSMGHITVTKSEAEILEEYYDYWVMKMTKKYGEEKVKQYINFDSCVYDWAVIHGAWKS